MSGFGYSFEGGAIVFVYPFVAFSALYGGLVIINYFITYRAVVF